MQKKTYTIEEVQELMDPLFKQIEFYQDQYLQAYYFISELPGWVKFLLPGRFLNNSKNIIKILLKKVTNGGKFSFSCGFYKKLEYEKRFVKSN